jgi:hypothetical protein
VFLVKVEADPTGTLAKKADDFRSIIIKKHYDILTADADETFGAVEEELLTTAEAAKLKRKSVEAAKEGRCVAHSSTQQQQLTTYSFTNSVLF